MVDESFSDARTCCHPLDAVSRTAGGEAGWSDRVDQTNAHRAESTCDGSHRANGNPGNGCARSVSTDGMRVLKGIYSAL